MTEADGAGAWRSPGIPRPGKTTPPRRFGCIAGADETFRLASYLPGGATLATWALRLSASATHPDAFISSTKAARYFAPAERPLGVPIAWRISWNASAITRISGWLLA